MLKVNGVIVPPRIDHEGINHAWLSEGLMRQFLPSRYQKLRGEKNMSRLLKFDYDGSLWRYERDIGPEWHVVPYKIVSESGPWKIRKTKTGHSTFNEHIYAVLGFNGRELEVDAVLGKRGGPLRISHTTIVHLDSEIVGIARRTGGVYGGGNSGFTYVEIGDALAGISAPPHISNANHRLGAPTIEVWSRTSTYEEGREAEASEIEPRKVPARDRSSMEQIRQRSPLGRYARDGRTVVADGTGLAPPWYGNPRDLRRLELGDPD